MCRTLNTAGRPVELLALSGVPTLCSPDRLSPAPRLRGPLTKPSGVVPDLNRRLFCAVATVWRISLDSNQGASLGDGFLAGIWFQPLTH